MTFDHHIFIPHIVCVCVPCLCLHTSLDGIFVTGQMEIDWKCSTCAAHGSFNISAHESTREDFMELDQRPASPQPMDATDDPDLPMETTDDATQPMENDRPALLNR